jgi:prolyl oligopeptidase
LLTIEQEVDRYIGMPGQALAYKMGQIEILDLRRRAKEYLGDEFDIKQFHDVMLSPGAMTLPMLRRRVEEDLLAG